MVPVSAQCFGVARDPVIETVLAGHAPVFVGVSGGKDSSVLANLALAAACQVQAEGCRAVLAVTHADVGAVENPEIRALVRDELACMRRFTTAKGLTCASDRSARAVRILRRAGGLAEMVAPARDMALA